MKKLFLLLLIALLGIPILKAQDVITLKDGTNFQAKILEVTPSEIKYKKYSNLEGPVFVVNKTDVLSIRYENGETDVFTGHVIKNITLNTTEPIREGMKYSEYRKFYNTKDYYSQPTDPYSRFWAGFASAIIPGLGQGVAGEWGRGALICLGNIGINTLARTQRSVDSYGNYTYTDMYGVIMIVALAYNIWSICDAVHVARVKNMYNQDIRALRAAQLAYSVSPFVSSTPDFGNGNQPLAGLSFTISF